MSEIKSNDPNDYLTVKPRETDKSKIELREAMSEHIIPCPPISMMMCGKSGSGKTQLLLHMLNEENCYKNYFDITFLFSETAKSGCDDLYEKHANIPNHRMFKPDKDGLAQLDRIITIQKKIIKKEGISKAPKILLIFDDIAHSRKFLASNQYLLMHIANRHFNITVISLTQSYVKIPRSCRCQVGSVFFFNGATNTEKLRLSEEHTPSNYDEKEFMRIINYATDEKYNFLYINKKAKPKEQYRKNLKTILELNR